MIEHFISDDGTQHWVKDGKRHRLDGPAAIFTDGWQEWWQDGKRHRLDGPAVIWPDGRIEFYHHGEISTSSIFDSKPIYISPEPLGEPDYPSAVLVPYVNYEPYDLRFAYRLSHEDAAMFLLKYS